ncbi:MAG: T9SS type A sorting domain-containing protein [Chitinophagaceae bacterium]|nr:T9SS type A sorting domain-containing protein [Chitinophagaceae bacterium]
MNLHFKNSNTSSLEIQLVNISGATVFKKAMDVNSNTIPVELPSMSSGVYILSVKQKGANVNVQKIIIR